MQVALHPVITIFLCIYFLDGTDSVICNCNLWDCSVGETECEGKHCVYGQFHFIMPDATCVPEEPQLRGKEWFYASCSQDDLEEEGCFDVDYESNPLSSEHNAKRVCRCKTTKCNNASYARKYDADLAERDKIKEEMKKLDDERWKATHLKEIVVEALDRNRRRSSGSFGERGTCDTAKDQRRY
uniref:EB domain-containing protein n=1 Tax=Steinernema glaseri TaxID=37863 RepID=A0A1I7YKI9_9BILA